MFDDATVWRFDYRTTKKDTNGIKKEVVKSDTTVELEISHELNGHVEAKENNHREEPHMNTEENRCVKEENETIDDLPALLPPKDEPILLETTNGSNLNGQKRMETDEASVTGSDGQSLPQLVDVD